MRAKVNDSVLSKWASDQKEALEEPDEAQQRNRAGRRLYPASLPVRAPHPEHDRQQQRDHQRLAAFDAEVESEQGQRQMAGREMEWVQGGGETESVEEAEEKAHHPARRGGVAEEDVLEGDVDDRCGDDALDEPLGDRDEAEHGEGERDAVGDGESGDDLEEREEAAAPEQQCPQEEEMVVAGQDVLDPEAEEAPLLAGGLASSEGDARLPCLGGEGEFADLPARLDLGQRVVIRADN